MRGFPDEFAVSCESSVGRFRTLEIVGRVPRSTEVLNDADDRLPDMLRQVPPACKDLG